MSFEAMAWAIKQKVGNSTAKFILLMVANYADDEGRAWPSQDTIAEAIEGSRHTVMRALEFLEEGGFLTRTRRHREDGSRRPDIIHLDLSRNLQRSKNAGPKSQIATAEPISEPIREKKIARANRLTEDWEPSEASILKAKTHLDLDAIREELEKFRNYWLAKSGADAAKLDWNRTFDNWILNAKDRRPTHGRERSPARNGTDPEARRRREIYEAHLVAQPR